MSKKYKNIAQILLIIIIIPIPYFIWHNEVKFSPEILLNEWYKTLFITGVIGLFYKYYIEKKINKTTNSKLRKKELSIIINKLFIISSTFTQNETIAQKNIEAIGVIIESSDYNYTTIKDEFINLKNKILVYMKNPIESKEKKEMKNQIYFTINKLTEIINNH